MTGVAALQSNRSAGSSGSGHGGDHVVRSGDTLWGIARRNGVSLAELERANPQIANFNLILPGQHVHVPGRGTIGADDGRAGAGAGVSAAGLPTSGAHANAAAVAELYLGRNTAALEADRSDALPMQAGIDPNECCANFVSAVLTQAGQLPAGLHTNSVRTLDATLRARGWTPIPASQARPGDVVIIRGGGVSHTEIMSGPGRMIGSNNVNRDGTQRISYNHLSYALAHGGTILRAPVGVGGGATDTARPAASRPVSGVARAALNGGPTVNLTRQDITDLKKVVATEWDQRSTEQAHGIIDTVLNRRASGHWGDSIAGVADARSQFSDINGPVAWRQGRHSVDDLPASRVSRRVSELVDRYLAQRANGAASSVGDNLNYANPNYSDARNLGWINRLDGPVLGDGVSIHRHGTTPDLQRYRPGAYQIALP